MTLSKKMFLEENTKELTIKEKKKRKIRLKDYCVRYIEECNDSKTWF